MKIILFSALAGLSAVSTVNVHAQAPAPSPVQSQAGDKADKAKERHEKLITELALTDDQAKKFRDVKQEQFERMKGLKDDTTLSEEQRMEKMKAVRAEADAKITAILTPEQKAKWEQIKKDRQAKGGTK